MTNKTPRKTKNKPRRKSPKSKKISNVKTLITKLSIQLSIVVSCLLIFWMMYLNVIVRDRFEGLRFKIPARVFSEAQELYAGAPIKKTAFIELLSQLGYRSSSVVSQSGRYVIKKDRVDVFTRGFQFWDGMEPAQQLTVKFNQTGVSYIGDFSGDSILLARLDPLYMGQIFPGVTEDRVLYSLNKLPERLVLGLLLVEDDKFFEHWGVSIKGIMRALFANLSSGRMSQGGSTLTQQLVKNLYLTPEKTLTRKVNEALMSLILEFHYSKNDILETYMNEVYIGQQGARSINGFGLGAQFYFGTTLQGLNIHQQAMLVGLIKGPSYYNPRRNPQRATLRRNLVLSVWRDQKLITEDEYQQASKAPLDVAQSPGQASYPAFMDALRRQLAKGYRQEDLLAEGLSIFTTLDPVAQALLETEMNQGLTRLEVSKSIKPQALEGAAVLSRPSTGDVLAMVGSRNSKSMGFNRALDAIRPVGSLMKPAVYLAALEQGYSLADTISDADVTIGAKDGTQWQPKNYDKKPHGSPMLIDALAKSYNQATARLGMEVGLPKVFDVIERLGVEGPIPLVPSVMLGAHGMSPFQIAQMYQTISGNGFYSPLNLIRAVSHPENGIVQRYDLQVSKRFKPEHIHLLQSALHEVTSTGTAAIIQRRNPQWWSTGKTGTTDENRDAWFAGFTGNRQLVVWVGRDDNKATPLTGSSGALPIWLGVMEGIDPFMERRGMPANITNISVNAAGINVPDWCDNQRILPFLIGTEPKRSLSCHSNELKPETEKKSWWQKVFGPS